ncbi:hypothetical protein JCM30760_15110 [Thiomicrorhabdus hydrogeniphila]
MAVMIEIYFMNSLPTALRKVAQQLYIQENLDTLVEYRLQQVSDDYQQMYSLTQEQWTLLLNALILTKLSQFRIGGHLSEVILLQVRFLVKLSLDMQEASDSEVEQYLQLNTKTFSVWYSKLLRACK